MDLTATIVPKSDQLNAEDLLAHPVTVTIESVTEGSAEQPVNINLAEFPRRPYRPSKTMRRVLVKMWGPETGAYTGRRLTLYRDPDVKFGGIKVGGIKISHLSHIDDRATLMLTETKGKRVAHTVQPLPKAAPAPSPTLSADDIAASTDVAWLREQWKTAGPQQRERIQARVAELTPPDDAA